MRLIRYVTRCLSGLKKFFVLKSLYFDVALNLTDPQDGAVVSLSPDAQKMYKSPKQRDWNTEYLPNEAKNGVDECSKPKPTIFRWNSDVSNVEYTLQLAETNDFVDAREFPCAENLECEIKNLPPDTKFFWRLKTVSTKSGNVKFSATRSFRTESTCPRWFDVPGITNVRDVGGWTTRYGKRVKSGQIYRGSEFAGHFNLMEEGRKILLGDMGIVVDLDLRGANAWKNNSNHVSPLGENVRWINFPIASYDRIFCDDQKKRFREMFHFLADKKNYPLYVHCRRGADRTGTLIMAINAILGVSDNDLYADYELSSFSIIGTRLIRSKYFQGMLKELNAYGNKDDSLSVKFENYLKSAGVTDDELNAIRNILLED